MENTPTREWLTLSQVEGSAEIKAKHRFTSDNMRFVRRCYETLKAVLDANKWDGKAVQFALASPEAGSVIFAEAKPQQFRLNSSGELEFHISVLSSISGAIELKQQNAQRGCN